MSLRDRIHGGFVFPRRVRVLGSGPSDRGSGTKAWDFIAPRTFTLLVLVTSGIGLLTSPISAYDDSILLVGARLVASGKLPYVDFYTLYGPLGYTMLSAALRVFGHPGLALRIGQITLLTGVAVLLHWLFSSLHPRSRLREYIVVSVVLAFSQIAMFPAFFGFAFAVAGLVLFTLARSASKILPACLIAVAAGAAIAGAALVLGAFGVAILVKQRKPAAILITLPFFLGAAAGALGLYPFSPTRHSAYLLPSAAFGIGAAVSALVAVRRGTVLLLLGVLVWLSSKGPAWATGPHTRSQMRAAVDELRRVAPPGSVVFADHETRLLLAYYLDGEATRGEVPGWEGFMESTAGGYCIVGPMTWNSERVAFGQEFERMVSVYRLAAEQPLWAIQLRSAYDPVSTYDPATALQADFHTPSFRQHCGSAING